MDLAIYGVLLGVVVDWTAAVVIHEGFHWVFIVQFNGSVSGWHFLPKPGWNAAVLSSDPWGTIALYGGGVTTGFILALLLLVVIQRFRQTHNPFWWGCGAAISWGFPMEFAAGIVEGAFNEFYGDAGFFLLALLAGLIGVALYWRTVPFRRNAQEVANQGR